MSPLTTRQVKNILFGRLFFDFFWKKIKKQAPKHHFISPPEAAKYFLHNLGSNATY